MQIAAATVLLLLLRTSFPHMGLSSVGGVNVNIFYYQNYHTVLIRDTCTIKCINMFQILIFITVDSVRRTLNTCTCDRVGIWAWSVMWSSWNGAEAMECVKNVTKKGGSKCGECEVWRFRKGKPNHTAGRGRGEKRTFSPAQSHFSPSLSSSFRSRKKEGKLPPAKGVDVKL